MKKVLGSAPSSKASSVSTANGTNSEKMTSVAGWIQKDTLLVYTSQDVQASNKVKSPSESVACQLVFLPFLCNLLYTLFIIIIIIIIIIIRLLTVMNHRRNARR